MRKIDKVSMISTKKGDTGQTRNYSNRMLSKGDLLFEALGDLDELSSMLGIVYHKTNLKEEVKTVQRVIQKINSMIATDDLSKLKEEVLVTEDDVSFLEGLSSRLLPYTEILPVFVLPGSDSSLEGAFFDLLRSVSRRSERSIVRLYEYEKKEELKLCLQYVNRLSDTLFIIARYKK